MRSLLAVLALVFVAAPVSAIAGERTFGEARGEMLRGLRAKDPAKRSQAVYFLDGFDTPEAARALARFVLARDDRAQVIRAGIQLLGGMRSEESLAVLAEEAKAGGVLKRSRVIESLARTGQRQALPPLLEAAYEEDPRLRVAALLGLENFENGRVDLALADGITAKEWPVRSAAVHVARLRRTDVAVPQLIERLHPGVEEGRLLGDVHGALVKITGQRIGLSYLSWKRWYAKEAGKEPVEDLPVVGAKARLPTATLAGVETWGRRVLFVLAMNDTMRHEITIDPARIAPPDVQRAGGAELAEWTKVETKMELARLWLAWAIDRLHPDCEFTVVTYGTSVNSVFDEFVAPTPENRKRAVRRVIALSPSGNADLHMGLQRIYTFLSRDPLDDVSFLEGPDVVYFLSDGAAGEGEIKDGFRAFEEAERLNRLRQIRFHVIGFGQHDSRVLADLAGMVPGGAYVVLP